MSETITKHSTPLDGDEDQARVVDALLERHGIPADKVQALLAKYSDLWVLDDAPVIFKKPTRGQFKMFGEKGQREKGKMDAVEEFARSVVVFPDASALNALLDEYPGLMATISADAASVAMKRPLDFSKKVATGSV